MKTYQIAYSGWTTVEVQAETPEQAIDKFWEDGLNDLNDAVIDSEPQELNATGE